MAWEIEKSALPITGVNRRTIGIAALIFLSIFAAMVLILLPNNFQLLPVFLLAAAMVFVIILINPYVGVFLYFFYEFLRPYDFIPALVPLRIAMVIEITTMISWVLYLIRSNKIFEWDIFYAGFMAWIAVIGFTVVAATNNRAAFNIFQSMVIILVMMIIASNIVKSYDRLNKLIWLLLFIHFYFALRGIYNYAFLHYATGSLLKQQTSGIIGTSFLADENDFALALDVIVPFAFFIFIYSRRILSKIVSAVILIVLTLAVIVSFSRGGWLGFVAAMIYCVAASRKKLLSISIAVLMGLVVVVAAPSSYWKVMKTICIE